MKKLTTLIALVILAFALDGCQDPNDKPYIAQVYNPDVIGGELEYLQTLDYQQLTPAEQDDYQIRSSVLPNLTVYSAVYLPRPPVPCPAPSRCIPEFTRIRSLVIGIFSEFANQTEVKLMNENGQVFAVGSLSKYDATFRTAWYTFTVVDGSIAAEPLLLDIKTAFTAGQQVKTVAFNVAVPANTFVL